METFLLFLYTALLSVLIAFLLGKIFADDGDHGAAPSDAGAAAAGGRVLAEVEKTGVSGDGNGGEGLVRASAEDGDVVASELCSVDDGGLESSCVAQDLGLCGEAKVGEGGEVGEVGEKSAMEETVEGVAESRRAMTVEDVERVAEGDEAGRTAIEVEGDDGDVKRKGGNWVSEDCVRVCDELVKEDYKKGDGEEVGREVSEEVESLLQGEDEWEGIETTEIEKLFKVAIEYVGSRRGVDEVSKLSPDVQMQLYGLHKVATEGPCYEAQPMALKVSSRTKWYAWQRLGSMNPEAAMEQYISLLSESIPGWMRARPRANVDQKDGNDPPTVGLPGNEASDSRFSEDSPYPEGGTDHGAPGSKFIQGLTKTVLFNLISPSRVAWLTL